MPYNPYAPTSFTREQIRAQKSTGSIKVALVAGVAVCAYVVFTIVLLRSSPPDRKSGMMFLANIPVLVGLFIFAFRSTRVAVYFAVGAASIQFVIMAAMLLTKIGDAPLVIGINSAIATAMLAIAFGAWLSYRRVTSHEFVGPTGKDDASSQE